MQVSEKFVDFVGTLLTTRAVADSSDLASRLKITVFNDFLKSELQSRLAHNGGKHNTAVMMSMCMVVAANHRTSFELLLGTQDYVTTNVFGPHQDDDNVIGGDQAMLCFTTFNGWLKQEGSKVLKKFIEETMMTSDTDDDEMALKMNYALASLQQGLWNYLARHVRSFNSNDGEKVSGEEDVGVLAELPGFPHVAIHECSAAPVVAKNGSGGEAGEEEEDTVKEGWLTLSSDLRRGTASLEPFSELLRIPGTQLFHIGTVKRFSRWMRLLCGTCTETTTPQCCDQGCEATPSPTSQYPKVQKAISEAISDDESRLLLSFVFEGKRAVAAKKVLAAVLTEQPTTTTTTSTTPSSSSACDVDHYSFLLSRIPLWYPTVPTHWSPMDYMMLTGTDLAEVVPQKKEQLSSFVCDVKGALFSALRIPALPENDNDPVIPVLESPLGELHSDIIKYLAPELSSCCSSSTTTPTTLLAMFLQELFSEAHVQWARATFDSRAFNLNFNGEVRLVLAPVIDMVNHNGDRSDILVRRVDPITQDFVIENGAALPPQTSVHPTTTVVAARPQELFMSYGPLQNWELLLSYGFAFNPLQQQAIASTTAATDREEQEMLLRRKLLIGNAYDRVPLPLDLSGEDDATDEESLSFVARRKPIIDKACLQVGQGVWVGPPVQLHSLPKASLEALRQGAINNKKEGGTISVEHYDVLESIPAIAPYPAVLATLRLTHSQIEEFPSLEANPFKPVSDETEATMVATLSAVLRSIILSFYNPSVAETVDILTTAAAADAANKEEKTDDEDKVIQTSTMDNKMGEEEEEEEEDGGLPVNEALSYFVNLPLLAMAHGCLRWCCDQTGEDFKVVVEETLNQLNYDDDDGDANSEDDA